MITSSIEPSSPSTLPNRTSYPLNRAVSDEKSTSKGGFRLKPAFLPANGANPVRVPFLSNSDTFLCSQELGLIKTITR